MLQEEYEYIKKIGEAIGYIFDNKFDNLISHYDLKLLIIDISKNYSVTHDLLFLRRQLNNLPIDQDIKDELYVQIQQIDNLKGDKLVVYSNNIHIPNDEEFINHHKRLLGSKPLQELYHVPSSVIASKIFEINRYGKKEEKSRHMS